MATRDAARQVAHRAGVGGHHVDRDAQPVAVHALRVADAAVAVDGIAERYGVNDLAVAGLAARAALAEHAAQVVGADLVAVDGDLDLDALRLRVADREVDIGVADGVAGHLLGGMDRGKDRLFGRRHVDHGAGAQAVRDLMANAGDAQGIAVDARDEAAHLGSTDVDRRDAAVADLALAHLSVTFMSIVMAASLRALA